MQVFIICIKQLLRIAIRLIEEKIMEFNEKLQLLRKQMGITQEELADELFVSRTAVSKWEQGRGYPNIESLKDISRFFSVSIDDLLSGERLLSIAEGENKSNIRGICDFLFGLVDLTSVLLIVLPLYPHKTADFISSVSLFNYVQGSSLNKSVYWLTFSLLFACGIVKLILTKMKKERANRLFLWLSLFIGVFAVLYLSVAGEVYAIIVAFLLVLLKGILVFKRNSN